MNPILADMYSSVIPAAPYLIAAYALIWIVLLVYVVIVAKRIKNAEKQIAVLEESIGLSNEETI